MATLYDVLKRTQGELHKNIAYSLDEAKLEARFILEHVLKIAQKEIIRDSGQLINIEDQSRIECISKKRAAGTPLPYIFGEWSFYGRTFKVNPHVLIPRAETETLIVKALSKINTYDNYDILDLGCGTGIIGITIALERPLSKVTLIDQSAHAIKNTKENQSLHQVSNVIIEKSNWFSTLGKRKFDIIVSNPPYLQEKDAHLLNGLEDEPFDALVSGPIGTEAIQYIIENAKNYMKSSGWLFIEHGYFQDSMVKNLFELSSYRDIEQAQDIHELHRLIFGKLGAG